MKHLTYTLITLFAIFLCLSTGFLVVGPGHRLRPVSKIFSEDSSSSTPIEIGTGESELALQNETPEEKYKREKLAEIAERKAAEVFVTRSTGRFECQACGYIYDESAGYTKKGIPPGTLFESIEKFRCPQCGANKKYFVAETETLSGFKENLKYGLGGNNLTGEAKTGLIFGGLAVCFALLMGGYMME